MKLVVILSAILFSALAFAQILPLFGTARFGSAIFGGGPLSLSVPFAPMWAVTAIAIALWMIVYCTRNK